ncbi:hypothetical protein M422DRAFT_123591, partial [Sphaerobolus stellatus SS14]
PNRDGPNPNYYAASMLTIFKPWRTISDLKNDSDKWTDSFHNYKFTNKQQELMKYFNIKHECIDPIDDYYSKQKSN